ncbi:MAG TPA: hypothetical protein ENG03_03170 [Thioploca sp.]|nr:hypothetical protein [Thioploca sp.]
MKNCYLIYLLLLMASLLTPSLANAEQSEEQTSWFFQPRLTTGMMHYEFEYAFTAPGATETNKLQFDDYIPYIGGGAMLAYDRCFADTYFKLSATGKDGGGTKKPDKESVFNKPSHEFDRKDYAITLGCKVTQNLSFFAGYKMGETDIQTVSTKNRPYDRYDEKQTRNANFESDGLFLGAAYSYPIGKGQFGVKLAATKLGAEYIQVNATIQNNRAVGDGPKTTDVDEWFLLGNTIGWTAGVNWTAPLSQHFSYRISLDYYDYDFDIDSAYVIEKEKADFFNILGGGVNYDLKETMYNLQLQFLYQF